MAERSAESSLDSVAQQDLPNDPASSIHHADFQSPPTAATQDDNVYDVDPPQDKELCVEVQHQDGHSPDQPNQTPESQHQWEDGGCTGQNHTELESQDCLFLGQAIELQALSLDQFPAQRQANGHQAQYQGGSHASDRQSLVRERITHNPDQDQQKVLGKDPGRSEVSEYQGPSEALDQEESLPSHLFKSEQENHLPLLHTEENQNLAQQRDWEKVTGQGLSGDQHKPSTDQEAQLLWAQNTSLDSRPGSLNSQSLAPPLHSHYKLADPSLCLESVSPGVQNQVHPQGENHRRSLDQVTPSKPAQAPSAGAAGGDEAGGSGGSPPALVITQTESWRTALHQSQQVGEPVTIPESVVLQRGLRATDLPIPGAAPPPADHGACSSDGGDMACSDLMSPRSDSTSLASEAAISGRSEEGPDDDTRSMAASSVMGHDDDTRSVAASSVTSLYHRVQLDPLEKDWIRNSALGNICAQRLLLTQDPSLVHKKTALHWAAKQGRLDTVDLMFLSGVDVNVRSGYTALHLASLHSHQHMVQALINTYNAKTNIRDYHGKMAIHYWSGRKDVFNRPEPQSVGRKLSHARRPQRYAFPALLLSRSRSQGQINLDFGTVPQFP